jgi:transcriptional regulator with XRE-family HTH domain
MKERGFSEIGKRLLSIRGALDQRAFARHVSVSQQAISNYERGNLPASWSFLRKVHEDFGINVNWLLTGRGARVTDEGMAAGLADNRPPLWARDFLEDPLFSETDRTELLLHLYFLYLATEPVDARARLVGDLRTIAGVAAADAARDGAGPALAAVYSAIGRDDRRALVAALIAAGEEREGVQRKSAMRDARVLYVAAMRIAALQGWVEEEAEATRRAARTHRKEASWDAAAKLYERALERLGSADSSNGDAPGSNGTPEVWTRTWLGYGRVAKDQGDVRVAGERYRSALEWALRSVEPHLRGEVYLDLACLAYHERDVQKGLDYLVSGRAFAEQSGEPKLLAWFRLTEALLLRERGDLDAARAILEVVFESAEREGNLAVLPLAAANLAEVRLDSGDLEWARDLLRRSETAARMHGNARNLAERMLLEARLMRLEGDEDAARARLLECLRFAGERKLRSEFERAAAMLEELPTDVEARLSSG